MTTENFNPHTIKALVFDLDGTLLRSDKVLSGRTLKAVRACMDRGIRIIIATGRAVESVEVYRELIGAEGPQVYYNGAEVVDMPRGKIIHTQFVPPDPIRFCLDLARKMGIYFQVYFPTGTEGPGTVPQGHWEILMTETYTKEAEYYRVNSGLQAVTGDMDRALDNAVKGIIKGLYIVTPEIQEQLRPILAERFGDSLCVVRSSPVYLEVLSPGVSKGAGLLKALNYLNLGPEGVIAFGDEENDLPMFGAAGFSAAPANAKQTVQEAAVFRIPSNDEDGIACFLEEKFAL